MKAIDVANCMIEIAHMMGNDHIDNLKLNKLLYFAQAQSLLERGTPLFSDPVQAWDYGPVVRKVYNAFKSNGKDPIKSSSKSFNSQDFRGEDLDVIIRIIRAYGNFASSSLVEMTHAEGSPWKQSYQSGKSNTISNESIIAYHKSHPLRSSKAPIARTSIGYRDADGYLVLPADYD